MSDRRDHLHFRLNYAEELRIRKELERLLKLPQRAVRHDTVESRSSSSSPISLKQDPNAPQSNQCNSLSLPKSGVTSRLSPHARQSAPGSALSKRDPVYDNIEKEHTNIVSILSKGAISSREFTEESRVQQHDQVIIDANVTGTDPDIKRPAIASMVGTTKPISVFIRPEPPSKPRSYMPQGSVKTRISTKPPAAQKKVTKMQKGTRAPSSMIRKGVKVRATEVSEDSSSSSSCYSQDSDDSSKRAKSTKKKKKRHLKTTRALTTPEQEKVMCVDHVTPATQRELFEVADISASLSNNEHDNSTWGTMVGANAAPPMPPMKATARTVEEIIASLQSPESLTASDLMIKQLMESVLGLNYNVTFGEIAEEKCEVQEEERQLKYQESSSAELLSPDQKISEEKCEVQEEETQQARLKYQESSSELLSPDQGLHIPGIDDTLTDEKQSLGFYSPSIEKYEGTSHKHVSISAQEESIAALQEEEMTEEEAKEVLKSAAQLTISDIIHVKGDTAPLTRREPAKTRPPAALLATWKPRTEFGAQPITQTIHHLCTVSPSHVLPSYLQLSSRLHHTVDRKGHMPHLTIMQEEDYAEDAKLESVLLDDGEDQMGILQDGVPTSTLQSQPQRGSVVTLPPRSTRSLDWWQKIAEYYVEGTRMELVGDKASLNPGPLKMFWAPAPPKFSAPLSLMQKTLFSKYESCLDEQYEAEGLSSMEVDSQSSDEEHVDPEDLAMLDRVLSRRHTSLADITCSSSSIEPLKKTLSTSAPDLSVHMDTTYHLSADFQTSMKELEMWNRQNHKSVKPLAVSLDVHIEAADVKIPNTLSEDSARTTLLIEKGKQLSPSESGVVPKTFLNHVIPYKKNAKSRKRLLDPQELQIILQELNQPPRAIKRSISLVRSPVRLSSSQHLRSASLPRQPDFSSFLNTHGGNQTGQNVRERVRDVWNQWFDEVFPPSRASVEDEVQYFHRNDTIHAEQTTKKEVSWAVGLDSIPPVLVEDPTASVQDVEREILCLSTLIEEQETPSAFHYCRRGALNRKLGNITLALQDLDLVIKLEPQLLDAYWHRHLIYLLQGKTNEALDNLNFIIKYNKTHTDAYLSKAEIYKQRNDYTMSIVNYTQALKSRPTDDDIYFRRAQMYEAQDELIIAMDDYAKCYLHNPSRTDALMKHGLYCFENSNWSAAVQNFTAVIKQEFANVQARTYRGRAYTKLARYNEAAEDFSSVIHLDPKNWIAFYYRGCLLRKCYPQHALKDFSVSVLLHDGFENLSAFLHRGILYTDLGLWSEAAFDFEHVLAWDKTVPVAHMNLGLISLLHLDQYPQAIRHFSAAIKVDPLCIRAYLCRAQAHRQMKDLHSALKDITRAIHLCPDSTEPYIIRGQYLYEMKRYDLASFCIHHAAKMTEGSSPVQQALVQSFHQQYNSAIECLVSAIEVKPLPALMILLGKIQMKAKKNKDASKSFRQALDILSQSDERSSNSDKAEVYYLLGLCYMEQFKFLQAVEVLTSAVKVRSGFCDAYFQRGLCRMHLQQAKCLLDFNKALEINPEHLQAYLCRAAFYGFRKRYSKAIMNCNAAVKVQPNSVRAYLYRGALKYYIKAYKLSIQDLTKATELDPSCSLVYYNRGVCYHEIKMYEEALKDYAIVLLLGGWKEVDIKVLVNRGLLYLELHDYANALEDFIAVAMKTPGDVKIHQMIGNCHQRLQHYEEAVQAFNQVLHLSPLSPEGYIGRGNAYMEYGHENGIKRAQADFVKALHLHPTCLAARICLGYNLQAQGFFQRSWNQFTVALDINAHSMLGFEGRAIVNLQMGDTFAALQDMNAALKLGVTAQLLTNRGVIHQFMGKLPNAMRDYQSAIAADTKYSLAYFNAANLYLHNRQFSQAREYYSQAIEFDPGNESAVLNRGIANMLLKDVPGALLDFHRVLDLCPVSSAAYFNRASLHNTLQQYQQAESDISQALILQPGDPLMYKLRADIRGRMGLAKEAIEDYEQAIRLLQQSAQI
ncbi:tetratricopeptide repeat protein 6 [Mixophyes fleayi]|uniref:tetratricopeptide repeat protein 6 n=1 Tax=Mixophyes fleayi TaxID=3061075 RepID=UPI003F4DBB2A